jgi:hypothetical protein
MNHHIKVRKMKKKPDNNYLCLIINETKTGVKVTAGKPAIILGIKIDHRLPVVINGSYGPKAGVDNPQKLR